MMSAVVKRSVVAGGHKTSISLEADFWDGLREIAKSEARTLTEVITAVDRERDGQNLSSAIRVFVYRRCLHRLNEHEHPIS